MPEVILTLSNAATEDYTPHTIACVKAIRMIALNSLKEAKDGWDGMRMGKALKIEVKNENSEQVDEAVCVLAHSGVNVVKGSRSRNHVITKLKEHLIILLEANDFDGSEEILSTIRRLTTK